MTTNMASRALLPYLLALVATLFGRNLVSSVSIKATLIYPFNCSAKIKTCTALLYHTHNNLTQDQIASLYSVNSSQMKSIMHGKQQDYLITVPCSCKDADGIPGYFYNTSYQVREGDTFDYVSAEIYSGQAWKVAGEKPVLTANENFPMLLPCGCAESDSQIVVTYTVQENDTLSEIAKLLSAHLSGIQSLNSLNRGLAQNPALIDVGWVLFVPMEKNGIPTPKGGELLLQL